MGNVNFYLKKPEPQKEKKPKQSAKSLIYLQYKYNGKKLIFSFGQTVIPKNWNKERQRVKNNAAATADGKHLLNDLLDNLEKECERAYNSEIKNGIPEPPTIKGYLINFMNQQSSEKKRTGTLFDLIEKFVSGEIKHNGRAKTIGTLKTYKSTLNHLKRFSAEKRFPVDFNTIDLDFYNKFTDYLEKRGLKPNTIGRNIKDIKTFMGEAFDRGLTANMLLRKRNSVNLQRNQIPFILLRMRF